MWETCYDLKSPIEYKFALAVCTRHKLCTVGGGGPTKFVYCANVLVQISGYETGYGHQVCVCTSVDHNAPNRESRRCELYVTI
jgi:hypothetical protein